MAVKQSLRHNEPKKFRAFSPKIFNEHPFGRSLKFAKNAIGSLLAHMIASLLCTYSGLCDLQASRSDQLGLPAVQVSAITPRLRCIHM